MIQAKELLRLIRFKEKDNNEIRFSDYDIQYALNEALRYIGQSQALQNSDFLDTIHIYNEKEINDEIDAWNEEHPDEPKDKVFFPLTGVELPEDFQILSDVALLEGIPLKPCPVTKVPMLREYKVLGGRIYAGIGLFQLAYKRTLMPVTDLSTGTVDLPDFFTDMICKITSMVLNQAETDVLLSVIRQTTEAIVPRRRYTNAQMRMPFYC